MNLANVTVTRPVIEPELLATIQFLHNEVYAEPPYLEGPDEVAEFIAQWNRQVGLPGFGIVLAHDEADGNLVGFCFGLSLRPRTRWWKGLLDPVDSSVTAEDGHRSFAIIELAVRATRRRRGIGRALHDALLTGCQQQRAVLLARPEALPAVAAYAKWGYHTHGRLRPAPGAPVYLAMSRELGSSHSGTISNRK